MMHANQDLLDAKARYSRTGHCYHERKFRERSNPYGTDVTLINCGVCQKEIERKYN